MHLTATIVCTFKLQVEQELETSYIDIFYTRLF